MTVVSDSLVTQYTPIDDRYGCRCCEAIPDTPCPAWCEYAKLSKEQQRDVEAIEYAKWQSDAAQRLDKQGRRPDEHALLKARYRSVYIRQDRIKAKHPRPIVIDDREGLTLLCSGVQFGTGELVYKPNHEDGSCLWFESSDAIIAQNPEIGDPE